jgi:hypothetical protein
MYNEAHSRPGYPGVVGELVNILGKNQAGTLLQVNTSAKEFLVNRATQSLSYNLVFKFGDFKLQGAISLRKYPQISNMKRVIASI